MTGMQRRSRSRAKANRQRSASLPGHSEVRVDVTNQVDRPKHPVRARDQRDSAGSASAAEKEVCTGAGFTVLCFEGAGVGQAANRNRIPGQHAHPVPLGAANWQHSVRKRISRCCRREPRADDQWLCDLSAAWSESQNHRRRRGKRSSEVPVLPARLTRYPCRRRVGSLRP
jgi:hypothetical protein